MTTIKQIVEENDTPKGFWFDVFIQFLIVVSLIGFSIETLPNLPTGLDSFLWNLQVATVVVFSVEYVLRVFVASNRLKFVFSFFGIIDLVAILPFYLSTGLDFRSLRAFRLLRLFQAFKLVRYSRAVQRYHRALIISWEELVLFLFVSLMMIYFAAAGIYLLENDAQPETFASIFHSLWWAIVTLTTVGYGDAVPITVGGRVFTFVILLVALGIISVPSGIIAAALQEAREIEKKEKGKATSTPGNSINTANDDAIE